MNIASLIDTSLQQKILNNIFFVFSCVFFYFCILNKFDEQDGCLYTLGILK